MTNSRFLPALLSAVILSAAPLGVRAQSANLPSAPSASAPAKPIFRLPLGTPTAPTGPPPAAPDMECYAPAEGIYGKQRPLPPAQKEAVERYMFAVIHQLDVEWKSHMPRAASDPWVKGKTVAVRFAIKPDGTIDDPVVTLTSGRRSYDNHALDAVLNSAPFLPLPEGVKRPVPICMRFGYNTDPGAKKSEMPDLWPPPAKQQAKRPPVEGDVNPPANNPAGSQPK